MSLDYSRFDKALKAEAAAEEAAAAPSAGDAAALAAAEAETAAEDAAEGFAPSAVPEEETAALRARLAPALAAVAALPRDGAQIWQLVVAKLDCWVEEEDDGRSAPGDAGWARPYAVLVLRVFPAPASLLTRHL